MPRGMFNGMRIGLRTSKEIINCAAAGAQHGPYSRLGFILSLQKINRYLDEPLDIPYTTSGEQ